MKPIIADPLMFLSFVQWVFDKLRGKHEAI